MGTFTRRFLRFGMMVWVLCFAVMPAIADGFPVKVTPAISISGIYCAPLWIQDGSDLKQVILVDAENQGEARELEFRIGDHEPVSQRIGAGPNTVEIPLPPIAQETASELRVSAEGTVLSQTAVSLRPVKKVEMYLLNHSHVDIGYTDLQTTVEWEHWQYFDMLLDLAKKTKEYPPEARFKWNLESQWALRSYLQRADRAKREAFAAAVRGGFVGLDAYYCQELTGLCRPEELIHLLDSTFELRREYGFSIDSAMVTDVPGQTWGIVPVLAQAGVKYLSLGPNANHRIGYTREEWDNKPFYWESPCGQYRVLCWQTATGYGRTFHDEASLKAFVKTFDRTYPDSPYDMVYIRHCRGDNDVPDLEISEVVKAWNRRYAWPRLIISTTSECFGEMEKRYGSSLPTVRGDFTPYWEDGAASSAHETALNRASAERLVQAETLWTLLKPDPYRYPFEAFDEAWRNVILYDEHTWGARSYVHKGAYHPGSEQYQEQWRIKRNFAVDGSLFSRRLLSWPLDMLKPGRKDKSETPAIDVINTNSWPRTDVVILPGDTKRPGDAVRTEDGTVVPSQSLANEELAFLAENIPAFGSRRYYLHAGAANPTGAARAEKNTLRNGRIELSVNPQTGAIEHLYDRTVDPEHDFVDASAKMGLNEYIYVPGISPKEAQRTKDVKIEVQDAGGLVATLRIESQAPGCNRLTQYIRVYDLPDRIDIVNRVDKREIPLADLLKIPPQKEGVYFGFACRVPEGQMRVQTPWAVVRTETDQLAGACRNWLTVQRWVDVSSTTMGLTCATADAPMVQPESISWQPDPLNYSEKTAGDGTALWKKELPRTQTFYSNIMNNYWTTNYQHSQGGVTDFRYSLRTHRGFSGAVAERFGTEFSQPLLAVRVRDNAPKLHSPVRIVSDEITATSLRLARNGESLLIRLYNPTDSVQTAGLEWTGLPPASLHQCTLDQQPLRPGEKSRVELKPYEFVTLLADGVLRKSGLHLEPDKDKPND